MEFAIISEIMTDSIARFFQPRMTVQNVFQSESAKSGAYQQKFQPITTTSLKASKTENKRIFTCNNKQEQETLVHKNLDSFHNLQKLEPSTFSQKSTSVQEKEASANVPRTKEEPQQTKENSQPLSSKNTPYTVETWITRDGPQKLHESLNRLNLNTHNIDNVSLSRLSTKQLRSEKKNIKLELIRYDTAFMDLFKRMPTRKEKEPMKHLYNYYEQVKKYLDKAENEDKNLRNDRLRNQSLGNVSIDSDKGLRSATNTLQDDKTKGRKNKNAASSASSSGRKVDDSFEEQLSFDNFSKKEKTNNKQEIAKKPKLRLSSEEAQERIEILSAVKTHLSKKLHVYELEFTKDNNRGIKYDKDILPVEEDYKRYKEVKDEIRSLVELLKE